jgi:hypothetical protein
MRAINGWMHSAGCLMFFGTQAKSGYVVGVLESLDPDSWSLMFIASNDAEGEQEISLGMDT